MIPGWLARGDETHGDGSVRPDATSRRLLAIYAGGMGCQGPKCG
jgi:hypothetical protein